MMQSIPARNNAQLLRRCPHAHLPNRAMHILPAKGHGSNIRDSLETARLLLWECHHCTASVQDTGAEELQNG